MRDTVKSTVPADCFKINEISFITRNSPQKMASSFEPDECEVLLKLLSFYHSISHSTMLEHLRLPYPSLLSTDHWLRRRKKSLWSAETVKRVGYVACALVLVKLQTPNNRHW